MPLMHVSLCCSTLYHFCYVIFIAYTVYRIYCILLFEYVLDWMRLGYVFVVLQ